jgi:hypothetical protein
VGDEALRRSVEAAILPLVVSLGPWGVEQGHWLPDRQGKPVLWLSTRTEIERVALQSQVWLLPQVHVLLARVGVPPSDVTRTRLEFTSREAEDRLLDQ